MNRFERYQLRLWTTFCNICLLILLAVSTSFPAATQTYQFTKILDGSTPRPDGVVTFGIGFAPTTPAFDGKWVVFRSPGPQNDGGGHAGIWSFNTVDKSFHKLVDFNTSVPGSTATFSNIDLLNTAPIVRNGVVIFVAHDNSKGSDQQGLYSVPAAGGAIQKIANYSTPVPGGGTFTVFDAIEKQAGAFAFDGMTVVFRANGTGAIQGNYSAKPDGSSLALIADNLHPLPTPGGGQLSNFGPPLISGHHVVMTGVAGADSSTSYNALYLGMLDGNGAFTELLDSSQQLPGNPSPNFHTRFDAPVLALDGMLVVFRADDANNNSGLGFFGLYSTDLGLRTINKIADSNSALPGLGKLTTIAGQSVALSQACVLFLAADNTGKSGLYLWKNGTATRIVGTGDQLDGQTVLAIADPGPAALSGPSLVFSVDFGSRAGPALYLATPSANAVTLQSVRNAASYGTSSVAPGESVTAFGTDMGPATLVSAVPDANNRFPDSLGGVRILANGTPAPLLYVSDTQSAAILPFGIANSPNVQIVVEYNGKTSLPLTFSVTGTMPGLFSADTSGSGQGVIQNQDGTTNSAANPAAPGSTVVLWVSGLGPLNPVPADGSIVSGEKIPALAQSVSVTIGGQASEIRYSGPAPTAIAGLYQVNCVVPLGIPPGSAAVVVTSGGQRSQPNLTIAVR